MRSASWVPRTATVVMAMAAMNATNNAYPTALAALWSVRFVEVARHIIASRYLI